MQRYSIFGNKRSFSDKSVWFLGKICLNYARNAKYIKDVSSERRNPILANVMAQLDYMEKRGSGLTRICNET